MMLTDHEWLRFVSYGILVGGVLGATNAGGLLISRWPLKFALVGALGLVGVVALVVHAIARTLLDRATTPPEDSEEATKEATE